VIGEKTGDRRPKREFRIQKSEDGRQKSEKAQGSVEHGWHEPAGGTLARKLLF